MFLQFLLQLFQFGQDFIIVVMGHGIHEDGVDQRQTHHAAEEVQDGVAGPGEPGDKVRRPLGNDQREGCPVVTGQVAEDGEQGDAGIAEILRRNVPVQGGGNDGNEEKEHDEGDADDEGGPHGQFDAFHEPLDVRDELEKAEGFEYPQRPQGQEEMGGQARIREEVAKRGHRQEGDDEIELVPSILPIRLPPVDAQFHEDLRQEKEGEERITPDKEPGGIKVSPDEDKECIDQDQYQHDPVIREDLFHKAIFSQAKLQNICITKRSLKFGL